jgi:hypothetical protein
MPRIAGVDRIDQVIDLINQQLAADQIAAQLDLTKSYVYRVAKAEGLKIAKKPKEDRQPLTPTQLYQQKAYIERKTKRSINVPTSVLLQELATRNLSKAQISELLTIIARQVGE